MFAPGKFALQTQDESAKADLLGLTFSGGGIRSATFNLGVLQALAEMGMLRCFDYLSTVSGGGYIGSWLAGWIEREQDKQPPGRGAAVVAASLSPEDSPDPDAEKVRPIRFLREYSNYLTPQAGFFSADTWTMIATYVRNTSLNLTILIAAICALLLLPHLLLQLVNWTLSQRITSLAVLGKVDDTGFLIAIAALLIAAVFIGLNLRWFAKQQRPPFYTKQNWIQWLVIVPIFVSSYVGALRLWQHVTPPRTSSADLWCLSGYISISFAVLLLVIGWSGRFYDCFLEHQPDRNKRWRYRAWAAFLFVLYPLLAGLGLGILLLRASAELFRWWHSTPSGEWSVISWGVPVLIVSVFSSVVVLHIGLMGRNFPDERREWWGRLGAWLMIFSIAWVALFGIAIFGPELLLSALRGGHKYLAASGITLGWVGTTLAGILTGKSRATGKPSATGIPEPGGILPILGTVAPYVFIIGLFLALSLGLHMLLVYFACPYEQLSPKVLAPDHWKLMAEIADSAYPFIFFIVCVAVMLGLSLTVDVNEFSMHHFYKNRLVRCYLGASRANRRRPNPFTGFDPDDDVRLAALTPSSGYSGPYPIINAALNLVHGKELAWQERKAESFTFTPKFCGFEVPETRESREVNESRPHIAVRGFRPTYEYAYPNCGIHIGTAVAISGAAASPNMGFHSSPPLAFLMTLFNVRLGWWLGNPRIQNKWQKSGPTFGLTYLLKDLLGLTDDCAGFISLSDGGHFENLGIYELVRRRCRFIVACDSEEDMEFKFGGLGNAIRTCRTDFGADISIDVSRIRRNPVTKQSQSHCVVGQIKYSDDTRGWLVYLKSSLTGDESGDVLEYAARQAAFPHQSTGDQWFDESQFESYRELGYHIAKGTFSPAIADTTLADDKETFFQALERIWYPPSPAIERSFTRHTQTYDQLMERLRQDPHLAFLDANFFPGFDSILNRPPESNEARRSAFYFCNSLIQLMENVFLDLNLQSEAERSHPHNAGWIALFQGWANSPVFIEAWRISANNYGERFRKFGQHQLGLPWVD